MGEFKCGDVVEISPYAAPYSGQLAVVTYTSGESKYGVSVRPLLDPDAKELAYSADELTNVSPANATLAVGHVIV